MHQASWAGLPFEIQLEVLEYLDREDLKRFRLVSKAFLAYTTKAVFSTIHISPNSLSFERAENVSDNESLANHVLELVYHVSTLDDAYINNFPTFREEILDQHSPHIANANLPPISEQRVRQLYDNYLEEVEAQRWISDESQHLEELIDNFPSLRAVSSVLDEYSPFGPPDGYIGRRTGMPTSIDDAPHSDHLFRTIVNFNFHPLLRPPLESVSLDVLGFHVMQNTWITLGEPAKFPYGLKHLHLGLFNSELKEMDDEDTEESLEAFSHLLSMTRESVTYLSLNFDELPFDDDGNHTGPVKTSSMIFSHRWPNLHTLKLNGIVAYEDEFVAFLTAHAATLKTLSLSDIEIVDEVEEIFHVDAPLRPISMADVLFPCTPGSVISFFHRLHAALQPKKVGLSGNFTNRFTEAWYVSPDPVTTVVTTSPTTAVAVPFDNKPLNSSTKPPSLRARLEAYLSHQGPSPFPPWNEYLAQMQERYEVKSKHWDIQACVEEQPPRKEWADVTWEWSPELITDPDGGKISKISNDLVNDSEDMSLARLTQSITIQNLAKHPYVDLAEANHAPMHHDQEGTPVQCGKKFFVAGSHDDHDSAIVFRFESVT